MQVCEKVGHSRNNACFCNDLYGSGGSKSRRAKAAGAEPAGQMRDEHLHAVVARSKFRSQNVQSTTFSPLLEAEMLKKRTQFDAERMSKSKVLKSHGC